MRRLLQAAAAVVGLLLLAGCVRVDGDLVVHGGDAAAPDTMSGTLLVAVSDEWALAQGQDPAALTDVITEELTAAAGSGITGEAYSADGFTGVDLELQDVPLDRLALASDGALQITEEDGAYVLSGDLSLLQDAAEVDGVTVPWGVDLAVTMPADVTDHNGTLDGRTVSWSLDADTDPVLTATAGVPEAPPWWTRVPPALWVLTALAAVGAVLAWVLGRRARERAGGDGVRGRAAGARSGSSSSLESMLEAARKRETGTSNDSNRDRTGGAGRGGRGSGRRR